MKISNYNYIEVVDCNNDTITLKEYVKYIDNVERDISYRKVNIHHDKKGQYFIYYRKKYYLEDF